MDDRALKRFMAKVRVNPETGCWEWTASRNRKGYGRFGMNRRNVLAHRAAYEHWVGPLPQWVGSKPPELQLDHLCKVRHCVNPDHLELVTHREHVMRGDSPDLTRVRFAAITHCPQGHEYTQDNTFIRMRGGYTSRKCRECEHIRDRRRVAAKRARRAMKRGDTPAASRQII